ncbi:hypothetical protein ACHAXR_011490 [Thalassiosira sp. AJA248-18]
MPGTTLSFDQVKLLPPDGAADNKFGFSVAIYGNTVIVCADGGVNDDASVVGSAYVFERDAQNNSWVLPSGYDFFGYSVALYEDTVVVGAYGDDKGAAYIFERDESNNWVQQARLLASDGAEDDRFGRSLDIYGDTIVVGAISDDDQGRSSGSAYVFVRDDASNNWSQQAKLLPDDGEAGIQFGVSVAIYSDTVIAGANGGYDNGGVRTANNWIQQDKLLSKDRFTGDRFGESVAIYGDTVIVSAVNDDDGDYQSGSAYIFVMDASSNTWSQQAKLLSSEGAANDMFGYNVAIYDNTVVVGAFYDDDNGSDSGSAYVFVRDASNNWMQQDQLLANDGAPGDLFGHRVAIYDNTVVVGARDDDDNEENSGSSYIFCPSQVSKKDTI